MSFTENRGPGEFGGVAVPDLSYSPDGTLIGGIDPLRAFLLDVHTGETIASIWGIGGTGFAFFNSVAFSPDGALIAFGAADGSIRLWGVEELLDLGETDAEDASQVLLGHEQRRPIVGLTFSPDGTRIASASWDTTVRVWDVESGSAVAVLDAHTDQAWGVSFHPDGKRVATSAADGTVRLWDLTTGTQTIFATVYPSSQGNRRALITDLQFTPDGSVLVGSHYSGDIYVWNTEQAVLLTRLDSGFNTLWHIDFNGDGTLLAAANYDSSVTLWGVPR
jgi:WD40 repeat protein